MAPHRQRAGTRPAIHEDRASREGSPIVQTGTPRRAAAGREPLGELTNAANTPQPEANIILEIDLSKPARKANQAERRGASSDALVLANVRDKENVPEVVDDSRYTTASPAVDAACRSLRKSPGKASAQRPLLDSPQTPASRAATSARKMLARAVADQELSDTRQKGAAELPNEDSGSPASKATPAALAGNERLEDSVVGFEALEDAIAEIGAVLSPTMATPTKSLFLEGKKSKPCDGKSPATPTFRPKAPAAANRPKATTPYSTMRSNATLKRKSDALKPAGQSSQTPKRTPRTNARPAAPPGGRRSTIGGNSVLQPASLRKAPFIPERSCKPATVSTFALPGEAVAAKLKARREEREKRASLSAQPASKGAVARPGAATVRGTAFAGPNNRARAPPAARAATLHPSSTRTAAQPPLGSVRIAKPAVGARNKVVGKRTSSASTTATQVNGSTRASQKVPIAHPPRSLAGLFTPPTSSEESTTGASTVRSPAARGPVRPRVLNSTRPAVTGRAATVTAAATHQERRAREEAARKARADAAERGRQASREWAERQRSRQQAATEAKKRNAAVVLPKVREAET